ncbi:MAG: cobalt transporter CbiM [Pseudomonadota bacterium]
MHISDGILSGPVLAVGFVGTAIIAGLTLRKMDIEEIPKVSVITAVFFVASLIHVPIGPSSVHLILNGLVGVVLGWRAFPAVLLGIILQAILFGHGGVSVIGVNTLMMGGGALAGYGLWQLRHFVSMGRKEVIFGALAGGGAVLVSGLILSLALVTTGEQFNVMAGAVLLAHIPIIIVEAFVVGAAAGFLARVRPQILAGGNTTPLADRTPA